MTRIGARTRWVGGGGHGGGLKGWGYCQPARRREEETRQKKAEVKRKETNVETITALGVTWEKPTNQKPW